MASRVGELSASCASIASLSPIDRKEHTYWMCGYTDGGQEYMLVCGQLFNHQSNVYHHINKIHKEFTDVGRLVSMLDLRVTDTFKCPGCRRECVAAHVVVLVVAHSVCQVRPRGLVSAAPTQQQP